MIHTLHLSLHKVEGAVIRALGLIERRGFSVTAMHARTDDAAQQMELTIQFHSAGRSPEVLARQIEKLFDVRHVSLVEESGVALKESFAC